jgi:arylsulfatase A-like enzyme/Flp pilus assembly protein TadD
VSGRRLLGVAVALAAAVAAAVALYRASIRPAARSGAGLNVLLVTLDTTRADRLGAYGYRKARTPRLDGLAAEGVRFTSAYSDVPVTLPAHASILTALYPFEHGVRNNGNFYLAERYETLATALRRGGYRTAAFVSSFILDRRYGLARGFETYDDRMEEAASAITGLEAERRGDKTALALARWLDARVKEASPPPPFFVWLHLYDPHEPYAPPASYRDLFPKSPYDGEIAFTDHVLGTVLDKLRDLSLLDRTLVAVVGDHGESLGEHGEETHSMFLYEGAIRVPMILWRPDVLPRGRVVAFPVRTLDLAPTILDVLGQPSLAAPHARSLRRAIEGRAEENPPGAYAETYVPRLAMGGAVLRALRDPRYKLIDAPRAELYDLDRDPGETRNLYAEEPRIVQALRTELHRVTAGGEGAMNVRAVDQETVEKLEALGYLGAGGDPAAAPDGEGKDPKDLIATFNRLRKAAEAVRARRHAEALPILQAVVAEDPRNAFAHMLLGSALVGTRDYSRAALELKAYLELAPTSAQAHHLLAVCYANLGDRTRALAEAGAALAIDPHFADARVLRAGILQGLGRGPEAVEELRAGVQANPEKPALRLFLAETLADAGQAGPAEAEYRAILQQDPTFVPALASLGALLLRRGALEEASGALRRALEIDPAQNEARFNLAGILEKQGRPADARAEYERVVGSTGAPPPVREAASRRLAALGR